MGNPQGLGPSDKALGQRGWGLRGGYHKGPHRVELSADAAGAVAPEHHHPGRHVTGVLAGHQQGQLPGKEKGTS